MKDELIRRLKEIQVVREQKVKLTSGKITNFYIDLKKAYGHPDIMELICRCMKPNMRKATGVAGMGHGGTPLATALALKYKLKLSLVREKRRQHGTGSQIDGYIPGIKDHVIVVDDVITTGGSLNKILKVLKTTGTKILGCAVVVKRGEGDRKVSPSYILEVQDLL